MVPHSSRGKYFFTEDLNTSDSGLFVWAQSAQSDKSCFPVFSLHAKLTGSSQIGEQQSKLIFAPSHSLDIPAEYWHCTATHPLQENAHLLQTGIRWPKQISEKKMTERVMCAIAIGCGMAVLEAPPFKLVKLNGQSIRRFLSKSNLARAPGEVGELAYIFQGSKLAWIYPQACLSVAVPHLRFQCQYSLAWHKTCWSFSLLLCSSTEWFWHLLQSLGSPGAVCYLLGSWTPQLCI